MGHFAHIAQFYLARRMAAVGQLYLTLSGPRDPTDQTWVRVEPSRLKH